MINMYLIYKMLVYGSYYRKLNPYLNTLLFFTSPTQYTFVPYFDPPHWEPNFLSEPNRDQKSDNINQICPTDPFFHTYEIPKS